MKKNVLKLNKIATALTLVSVMGLSMSGCSTMDKHTKKMADDSIKVNSDNVLKKITQTQLDAAQKTRKINWNKTPVLNIKKVNLKKELPAFFNKRVEINEIFPVDVKDLVMTVSQQADGLPINIETDVLQQIADAGGLGSASDTSGSPIGGNGQSGLGTDSTGNSLVNPLAGISTDKNLPSSTTAKISFNYSGTLKQTLNALASKLDASWRYDFDNKKVIMYRFINKEFYLPSIPGVSSISASISDAVTNSKRNAGFDLKSDTWTEIKENLTSMIEKGDGTFSISKTTGYINIRTTPAIMKRVTKYIESAKKTLTSQVLVDVKILSISQKLNDNRAINLGSILQNGGWKVNIAGGAQSAVTDVSSFVISTLKDQTMKVDNNSLTLAKDSKSIINLLNSVGKTSIVNEVPIRTINNQPAAASTTIESSYLSKTEITTDPNTGVQSSALTTQNTKVGLSLNILPTVESNGRDLMLQVAFNLSDIPRYNTVTTQDGSKVVTPVIDSRDFVQKIWLRSGQTLVLSGMSLITASKESSGPVNSNNWFFGGSKNNKYEKQNIVILITPHVYNAITKR